MIKFTSWEDDDCDKITYYIHPAKTSLIFMKDEEDEYSIVIVGDVEYDPIIVNRETFERVMREYNRYLDRNGIMSTE